MERNRGIVPFNRFMFIFSLVMSGAYILLGISIITSILQIPGVSSLAPIQRQLLGILLLLYGAFRLFKANQSYRNQRKDEK
jgi:hypothetical protein